MKVLILTEFFPTGKDLKFSGGVEARNYYISKYLANKHKITILTTRLKATKSEESQKGFKVLRVGTTIDYQATSGSIIQRLAYILSGLKKSEDLDVDLVEGTNFITHTLALIISRRKKIPAVAWYPDVWINNWIKNAGPVGLLGEVLERINIKIGFSKYIAISKETKKKLSKYTSKEILVIPCGVDSSEFKKKVKKEIGKIVCVSRLAKYKNIKDLVLAFALIAKENRKLHLDIIGRGPEEENLKELVKNLNLRKRVTFKSNLKRADLVHNIQSAQIFCLPSSVEGFGISVIEAAAAGTPYICTNIPVFKEVTKNYLGGLSFDANDIYDLSRKLKTLTEDKKLYRTKVKDCIKLAQNYSWKDISSQTEKIYSSLK